MTTTSITSTTSTPAICVPRLRPGCKPVMSAIRRPFDYTIAPNGLVTPGFRPSVKGH
jgi:hypothetical protein